MEGVIFIDFNFFFLFINDLPLTFEKTSFKNNN